jgi:hypothetical protein
MEPNLPRRRFLIGSALAAGAFLAPRLYSALSPASVDRAAAALGTDDDEVISLLGAYSIDIEIWAGPKGFARPKKENDPPVTRSQNFLVRVSDFDRLTRFLNSSDLDRFGAVYAGGPNLAFFAGTTAYTVTNYGPEDFFRATQ